MSTNPQPKVIVLCFDGTAGQYSEQNTNVIKFFGLLKKLPDEQPAYYQPGIGTYSPDSVSRLFHPVAKLVDLGIAWYLSEHVIGGYKYLMNHYRKGDKICIFGFSRGAYTARALAGFLFKIGLLQQDNSESIRHAYELYEGTDDEAAAGFKNDLCTPVTIDFLGVWDTVASVGIVYGRTLPFTSANSAVRVFRHALSLDERRARFRPNLYHRETPQDAVHNTILGSGHPECSCDALEVWFAGCHSDVGGSAVLNKERYSLADISLEWMVQQVILSNCGIKFDDAALAKAEITVPIIQVPTNNLSVLPSPPGGGGRKVPHRWETMEEAKQLDVKAGINDKLKSNPAWWILEPWPMKFTWQEPDGTWKTRWWPNFGRGRKIRDPNPIFHVSVRHKMENSNYRPNARWTPGTERYTDGLE
jgi:hypothetical protein